MLYNAIRLLAVVGVSSAVASNATNGTNATSTKAPSDDSTTKKAGECDGGCGKAHEKKPSTAAASRRLSGASSTTGAATATGASTAASKSGGKCAKEGDKLAANCLVSGCEVSLPGAGSGSTATSAGTAATAAATTGGSGTPRRLAAACPTKSSKALKDLASWVLKGTVTDISKPDCTATHADYAKSDCKAWDASMTTHIGCKVPTAKDFTNIRRLADNVQYRFQATFDLVKVQEKFVDQGKSADAALEAANAGVGRSVATDGAAFKKLFTDVAARPDMKASMDALKTELGIDAAVLSNMKVPDVITTVGGKSVTEFKKNCDATPKPSYCAAVAKGEKEATGGGASSGAFAMAASAALVAAAALF